MKLHSKTKNLINQKFGFWTVIQFRRYEKKVGAIWLCACDCGHTREVRAVNLLSGGSNGCNTCRNFQTRSYLTRSTVYGIPSSKWVSIMKAAKRRGIAFEITPQECYSKFQSQNGRCALTGLPLTLHSMSGTASLDRINSKKGYILDNIQWVHSHINRMKNIYDQEYFIEMCKLVTENS